MMRVFFYIKSTLNCYRRNKEDFSLYIAIGRWFVMPKEWVCKVDISGCYTLYLEPGNCTLLDTIKQKKTRI